MSRSFAPVWPTPSDPRRAAAVGRARELTKHMFEAASALAAPSSTDEEVGLALATIDRAWSGMHGRDMETVVAWEIVRAIWRSARGERHTGNFMVSGHDVASCARAALEDLGRRFPEYVVRLHSDALVEAAEAWSASLEGRRRNKWDPIKAVLKAAGLGIGTRDLSTIKRMWNEWRKGPIPDDLPPVVSTPWISRMPEGVRERFAGALRKRRTAFR